MASDPTGPPDFPPQEPLTLEQLAIYARELHQQYLDGQRLRTDLESRRQELEQAVRELAALNRLFQQYLSERLSTQDSYRKLVEELRHQADHLNSLAATATAQLRGGKDGAD